MNHSQKASLLGAAVFALLLGSAPGHASQADDRIVSSAKKSHVFETYLHKDDITVQAKDGVVTLTGTVSEDSHKVLAQETVAGLPGVKSVDNKLELKGAPTANSDAWLRDKVKIALLFHRSVNAGATEVDVKDGVVTLRGNASSLAQKDLTTEHAKDVEGVKGVNNEMVVAKGSSGAQTVGEKIGKVGGKIDDASITAQVKLTLLYHRSTSALKTSVTTKGGVVTLSGKAANAAELNLATKYSKDVRGVKEVKNAMTVE